MCMGKINGFLEYERQENVTESVKKRIQHFEEFHNILPKALRQQQGARCMDCGVPFCQSGMVIDGMLTGCPLHNLIPEWNDMIYQDHMDIAYERLSKTNNFPEFTSRVCPAPCEAACTCSLNDSAVTIKENEFAISEYAYEHALKKANIPAQRTNKKVAVIGSGPSGLALADQLNQRGHDVTVIEKADRFGGLLMYGIPNMKLDKKIINRRIQIMKEEGVHFISGIHIHTKDEVVKLKSSYDAIALACGSRNPRDIKVAGRDGKGIYFAVDYLSEVTKALLEHRLAKISAKGKRVLIIGGGDTGNDCCATALRQQANHVIQLEMMPKPPHFRPEGNEWPKWPKVLKTDYGQEECKTIYGKDPRLFQTTVKEFIKDDKEQIKAVKLIKLEPKQDPSTNRLQMVEIEGSEWMEDVDMVLIAAGFIGCESDIAEAFDIQVEKGRVVCHDYHTTSEKVFALGDMRRGQSLVVWGIVEGRECAKAIDQELMGYSNLSNN